MGMFDSDLVQQEANQLFKDYQSLMQLGGNYGKFDQKGKKIFIDQMESVMERYRIFMKRFKRFIKEACIAKIGGNKTIENSAWSIWHDATTDVRSDASDARADEGRH